MPVDRAFQNKELAFDHAALIKQAVDLTRQEFDALRFPRGFLGTPFTLSELQAISWAVQGRVLDKSSFRRRLADSGCLEEVSGGMRTGMFRLAQLFGCVRWFFKLSKVMWLSHNQGYFATRRCGMV